METLKACVDRFYSAHSLSETYPGLKSARLLDEVCYLFSCAPESLVIGRLFEQWTELKQELLKAYPLEYLSRRGPFAWSEFYVDDRVLIPRFETEHLVEKGVAFATHRASPVRVLDLCCGSGCIGLSVATKLAPGSQVVLSDIDQGALNVARMNSRRTRFQRSQDVQVSFVCSDYFEQIEGEFDLVLSNPPYIARGRERGEVAQQVHDFEPHLALYVEDDDQESLKKTLIESIRSRLRPGGEGHMEFGLEMIPIC